VEIAGEPIDPLASYSVTTNEFVLAFFNLIGIQATDINIPKDTTEFFVLGTHLVALQKATPKVEGRIQATDKTGIQESNSIKNKRVNVAPNPTSNQTKITFTVDKPENVRLTLYSSALHEVSTPYNGLLGAGEQSIVIDTKYLPSGAYLYRLTIGNTSNVGQIIVQK